MKYNFKKARQIINTNTGVKEARIGIYEYWQHTAELIYEKGKFIEDFDNSQKSLDMVNVTHGTPVVEIVFNDYKVKIYNL